MNIFFLDENPQKCAEYHCDKHVVKMILEAAQLLSICFNFYGQHQPWMNKPAKTWLQHPSAKWVRESNSNVRWLINLGYCLCKEYAKRYNKRHAYDDMFHLFINSQVLLSDLMPSYDLSGFALAMPSHCHTFNPETTRESVKSVEFWNKLAVDSYRNYYIKEKSLIAKWKFTNTPEWYVI